MQHHLALAREYLRLRRPTEAAQFARERLAALPTDVDAHLILALALSQLRAHGAAHAAATAAVGLAPGLARAHFVLAAVCWDGKQAGRAAVSLREALRLDPKLAPAHHLQARLHLRKGRVLDALVASDLALVIDPTNPDYHLARGLALLNTGLLEDAARSARNGLSQAAEHSALLTLRGHVHLRAGEVAEARAAFLAALRASPDLRDARAGLVEALRAGSMIHRVQAELREALVWLCRQSRFLAAGCMVVAASAVSVAGRDAVRAAQPLLFPLLAAVAFLLPETGNVAVLLRPLGRRVLTRTEIGLALLVLAALSSACGLAVAAWLQPRPEAWPVANAFAGVALFAGLAGWLIRHRNLTVRQRWRIAGAVALFTALVIAGWWLSSWC